MSSKHIMQMDEGVDTSESDSATNNEPTTPLNRRGLPARIRKKNPLFYNDDYDDSKPRNYKSTPDKSSNNSTPTSKYKTPSKQSNTKLPSNSKQQIDVTSQRKSTRPTRSTLPKKEITECAILSRKSRPKSSNPEKYIPSPRKSTPIQVKVESLRGKPTPVPTPKTVTIIRKKRRKGTPTKTRTPRKRTPVKRLLSPEILTVKKTPKKTPTKRTPLKKTPKKEPISSDDDSDYNISNLSSDRSQRIEITGSPPGFLKSSSSVTKQLNFPEMPSKSNRRFGDIYRTNNTADKILCQKLGMKLRNLLKLPKACKWVYYEFFYSNIDRSLLLTKNDFASCFQESFPQLKTTSLTRVEWRILRRLMGKPRRLSDKFLTEEIQELERKRNKIRLLQQRKASEIIGIKDIPDRVPLQHVIGSQVTARVRFPGTGGGNALLIGYIVGVDTSNNTCRIKFEKPGLNTISIPDYEISSNDPMETIDKYELLEALRQRIPSTPQNKSNLDSAAATPCKENSENEMKNDTSYPLDLLESIVRLNSILKIKDTHVLRLKNMNKSVEKRSLYQAGSNTTNDFRLKYATNVITLQTINEHVSNMISKINDNLSQLTPEQNNISISSIQEKATNESIQLVERINGEREAASLSIVKDQPTIKLITDLMALTFQIKNIAHEQEDKFYQINAISNSLVQIKKKLSVENQKLFENSVQVHIDRMIADIKNNRLTMGPFGRN